MSTENRNRIVWVDLETTGLDPDFDVPLEIAVVVTDFDLRRISTLSVPIKPIRLKPFALMEPAVRDMHESTGLLDRLDKPVAQTLQEAERRAVERIFGCAGQPPLGGSSVHFDRNFLRQYMPTFHARLSYRNIDVSTIRQLVQHWSPSLVPFEPQRTPKHKAEVDILNSIDELAYYRSSVFGMPPFTEPDLVRASDLAGVAVRSTDEFSVGKGTS